MMIETMLAPPFMQMTDQQWRTQQKASVAMMVTDAARAGQIADLTGKTPASTGTRYMMELLKTDLYAGLKTAQDPVAQAA